MLFWDIGAHDHMVEMMEHCDNTYFTKNPINLEFYAKSILKGHYFNLDNAKAIADILISEPESQTQGIAILGTIGAISKNVAKKTQLEIEKNNLTDETLSIYNKCFPGRSHHIMEVTKNYEQCLFDSIVSYEESFNQSFDCRYGCRVMHRLIEAGLDNEAEKFAHLTQLAAVKEGGLKSNNLSVVRAYLESLYVLPNSHPDEIELAEQVLFSLSQSEYQTLNSLASLQELKSNSGQKDLFIEKLKDHLHNLEYKPHLANENLKLAKSQLKQSIEDWELYTYNYKGVDSNYIEGNFKFGFKALPAQLVDRSTRKFFNELIDTPLYKLINESEDRRCLKEINDFEEFDKLTNIIIRQQFHTDEWKLEQLDSEGHKLFDDTFQALIQLSGADSPETRKIMNSQTALQNNFILGLGDCRHQTACKQMIHNIWHSEQLKNVLIKIQDAFNSSDIEKLEMLNDEFDRLNSSQLHTFDCEIHLPVKMVNNLPVWHEGHLVMNDTGEYQKVEEHTLNVQFTHDIKSEKLIDVTLRDVFYQNTYPWKSQKINIAESSLTEGVKTGQIELYNPATGTLELRNIITKPTRYAGTRDLYNRGSNDSRFLGQPVKELSLSEALEQKNTILANNKKACEWYRKKNNNPA